MTHLYLIRHGEALTNVDGSVAGTQGDKGLTDHGREQARRLRDRLTATGEIQADVLIASTLERARQTAEIIAPALGLPIIADDDVQEMRVGEADGMSHDEFIATHGKPDFRRSPFKPLSPGGENWPHFVVRVATALDRIVREHHGKTIVIVCHGGVIDASFSIFFGLGSLALPQSEFHTRNTSITHWELREREGEPPRWRLDRYNDDVHTHDIGADERIQWTRLAATYHASPWSDEPSVPLPTEEL
ncbi:MAG: histidine phosphatase family protein [Ktedonobacterales bacterium]